MEENDKDIKLRREKELLQRLSNKRKSAFEKFPLLFTMLSTFGLVATFYGFENIIDQIDVFANNPWTMLTFGIITLFATGTLYSKLS